jgi:hypothetical protein
MSPELVELTEILDNSNPISTTKSRVGIRYEYDEDEPPSAKGDLSKNIKQSYVQWSTCDGKVFCPANLTVDTITPGVYEIDSSPSIGIYFEKIPVKTDGLIRFPECNSHKVITEISKFWDRESVFEKYNLNHQRGIILWGPAGSGKSCSIQLIIEDIIARGGIAVKFTSPSLFIDGMRIFRSIQPKTPVVAIMEDIDSILERYSESDVLNVLDGVDKIQKIVYLATTNYPGRLGARIINRPSRFDKRFKIGYPSAEVRKIYLENLFQKEPSKSKHNIDKWVEDTDKFTIAHLKELFVAVIILEDPYNEAIETLRTMKEDIDERDDDSNNFGFMPKRSSLDKHTGIGRD